MYDPADLIPASRLATMTPEEVAKENADREHFNKTVACGLDPVQMLREKP